MKMFFQWRFRLGTASRCRRLSLTVSVFVLVMELVVQAGAPPGDENWDGRFPGPPGVNGVVRAAAVGPNGEIYVGGDFTMAINSSGNYFPANHVARWDGSGWSALGSGVDNTVTALAVTPQGELFVGGYFTSAGAASANHVAKWNGANWSALGNGVNNLVYSVTAVGDDIYVGGYFDKAGNTTARGVAKWNGTTWSALGGGISGSQFSLATVNAIAAGPRGEIYIAGMFQSAGGVGANNIAKWDGGSWSALGGGIGDPNNYVQINALAVGDTGELFVGGYFRSAGGVSANNLAKWDGRNWSALGDGVFATVLAVAVSGPNVYAGGYFSGVGNGGNISRIARWDGSQWTGLDTGVGGAGFAYVDVIAVDANANVYAGGNFTAAGPTEASFVARWNGDNWSALSGGINGVVYASAVSPLGALYVGGDFTAAGGVQANHIARWDGTNWSPLISGSYNGVDGPVDAIVVSGNRVFVGGEFTVAGGVPANHVAQWDGTNWTALATGVDDSVLALAADNGGNLYAGGRFANAGGSQANSIARWDGVSWSALGGGLQFTEGTGFVRSIAIRSGEIFAGGDFDSAGGSPAANVARWDGANWSALGSGLSGPVNALVYVNDQLYAGGSFLSAGGLTANQIARWNGTNWSTLGGGITSGYAYVLSLAAGTNGELFVGGYFDQANHLPANRIARWDGTNWAGLGAGLGGAYPYAYTLATQGATLFVGGSFDTAGGAGASRVARWDATQWQPLVPGQSTRPDNFVNGTINALVVVDGDVYVGGAFTRAGTVIATNIARWNGLTWSSVGGGLTGLNYSAVDAMAISGGDLYVGGSFSRAGNIAANNASRWNLASKTWTALGGGVNGTVNAIAVGLDGLVYVGGSFSSAGGVSAPNVACWNPTNTVWSALAGGVNTVNGFYPTVVNAILAHPNGDIYVGGSFNRAGGLVANGVARWSNLAWNPLGAGVTSPNYYPTAVEAIALGSDGTIYVGGQFTSAGGIRSTNVARWNTNDTWSALGSGLGVTYDSVSALAANGTNLFAGGSFHSSGNLPVANIARWNGMSWQTMGSGITGGVYPHVGALAAVGTDLYAAGEFTTAGGKLSYFFAHWNALGQTGYVPRLQLGHLSDGLTLAWPTAAEGFVLETADQLSTSATWTRVASPPDAAGDQNVITVRATNGSGFYRLNGQAASGRSTPGFRSLETSH
jgi:trimeric autotransporter adhesin